MINFESDSKGLNELVGSGAAMARREWSGPVHFGACQDALASFRSRCAARVSFVALLSTGVFSRFDSVNDLGIVLLTSAKQFKPGRPKWSYCFTSLIVFVALCVKRREFLASVY